MSASAQSRPSRARAQRAASGTICRWLLGGEWRSHPWRAVVAWITIALGVALGYAVQLINSAAFTEFSAATRSLSGQADLQIRGTQSTFDDSWYPRIATIDGVVAASPVLSFDAAVPGRSEPLNVIGIDVFRAAKIAPDLLGVPADNRPLDTLASDTIFLSAAAQSWLGVHPGSELALRSGTATVGFRVAGGIVRPRPGQRVAVMDIAAAQWRFHRLGRLSRIDLQLARGIDRERFKTDLQRELGGTLVVSAPDDIDARTDQLSRAYRVNMNVLALVALFTGAFLVFSTQALSVVRRRSQFAMLRVLGFTRRELLRQVLIEGAVLGAVGALVGLAAGYGMASVALRFFGSDLGGGYFPGVQPHAHFEPLATAIFFATGFAVSVLGSLAPALEAARTPPSAALKAGSEESALTKLRARWPALACLVTAAIMTRLPPVFDMPLFGYLAVAFLLIGGIAWMPRVTATVFGAATVSPRARRGVTSTLAIARLRNAPGQASIALGGVLSSFALIVAMAIMVASFRVSVTDWLEHLLSADLYARVVSSADTGGLTPDQQSAIAHAPGVQRAAFSRFSPLTLSASRPPLAVIAREIDAADPGANLQMTGATLPPSAFPPNETPIWISEAVVDLYRMHVGQRLSLPFGGHDRPFVIAGVWRDYARQTGAIQMRLSDYRWLTGDTVATDVAITIAPHNTVENVMSALRHLPFGASLEFSQSGDIRARTLTIFDRSFAITYLLEGVAIVIGLFGVAATFSAQALARSKEFGMLRHIGVTRRQVLAVLAKEGALLTALGTLTGFVLGFAIALILVYVVNPQSFHWTMSLHVPWHILSIVAALMMVSSSATAVIAGRRAVSQDAVHAVKEDW